MGCHFCDFNGQCQKFEDESTDITELGCDDDGYCLCEDDEDPEDACEHFQSDDDEEMEDED